MIAFTLTVEQSENDTVRDAMTELQAAVSTTDVESANRLLKLAQAEKEIESLADQLAAARDHASSIDSDLRSEQVKREELIVEKTALETQKSIKDTENAKEITALKERLEQANASITNHLHDIEAQKRHAAKLQNKTDVANKHNTDLIETCNKQGGQILNLQNEAGTRRRQREVLLNTLLELAGVTHLGGLTMGALRTRSILLELDPKDSATNATHVSAPPCDFEWRVSTLDSSTVAQTAADNSLPRLLVVRAVLAYPGAAKMLEITERCIFLLSFRTFSAEQAQLLVMAAHRLSQLVTGENVDPDLIFATLRSMELAVRVSKTVHVNLDVIAECLHSMQRKITRLVHDTPDLLIESLNEWLVATVLKRVRQAPSPVRLLLNKKSVQARDGDPRLAILSPEALLVINQQTQQAARYGTDEITLKKLNASSFFYEVHFHAKRMTAHGLDVEASLKFDVTLETGKFFRRLEDQMPMQLAARAAEQTRQDALQRSAQTMDLQAAASAALRATTMRRE